MAFPVRNFLRNRKKDLLNWADVALMIATLNGTARGMIKSSVN